MITEDTATIEAGNTMTAAETEGTAMSVVEVGDTMTEAAMTTEIGVKAMTTGLIIDRELTTTAAEIAVTMIMIVRTIGGRGNTKMRKGGAVRKTMTGAEMMEEERSEE